VLGALLSALVLFAVSGLATPVPAPVRYGVVVALAIAGVLRDTGAVRFPLPQNARQIPQAVLTGDVARGAVRFGFELGTGVRTYVPSTVPYILAVALLLTGPGIATAVAAGAGFGIGRVLTPATRYASHDGAMWDAALHAWLRTIKVTGGLAMTAALAILLFVRR
jgi:hypothetical protein